MIKFKSSEAQITEASKPLDKNFVFAVLPEILATTTNGDFMVCGRYEDEEGNILKPIRTTLNITEIDALQSALSITGSTFSEIWNSCFLAGATYRLNSDANYGETNWSIYEEVITETTGSLP